MEQPTHYNVIANPPAGRQGFLPAVALTDARRVLSEVIVRRIDH